MVRTTINKRHAICNLSMHGYGVVRTAGCDAVTVPTKCGIVTMSNECFREFLRSIDCEYDF